ncbi:MAG TPA: hypothetical protein VFU97_24410 [Xanthobacteraceae bacterium]|nr:hypothetical protein [Xanthobacteraceae bacterium]
MSKRETQTPRRSPSGPGGFRTQDERRAAGKTVNVSVTVPVALLDQIDTARGFEARSQWFVRAAQRLLHLPET